jgi:hypothetical protein
MKLLLRCLVRSLHDAWQLREDWQWHVRQRGPAFPPRWRRVIEQARLLRTSALDAEDYYRLGLHTPDLSFAEKSTFLGKYRSFRYYDRINPEQYEIFGHDKALMHWLALPLDIPMPRVLATTGEPGHPGMGERIAARPRRDCASRRRLCGRPHTRPRGRRLSLRRSDQGPHCLETVRARGHSSRRKRAMHGKRTALPDSCIDTRTPLTRIRWPTAPDCRPRSWHAQSTAWT